MEAYGIPLSEFTELTGKYPRIAYLKYNGENVIKINLYHGIENSRDKSDEEKIRRVEVSYCGTGTYTTEELEMFTKAIALTIHTCHGDMTEELWSNIMANPVLEHKRPGNILMSIYEVDTMEIEVYAGETTMTVECDAEPQ